MLALVVGTQIVQLGVGATDQQYLWESLLVGLVLFWIFGHHLYQAFKESTLVQKQGKKLPFNGVS